MPTYSRKVHSVSKIKSKKGLSFSSLLAIAFFLMIVPLSLGILYITILNPRAAEPGSFGTTAAAGSRRIRVLEIRYYPPNTPYRDNHTDPNLSINAKSEALRNAIIKASKPKGYKNASATPYIEGVDIIGTLVRPEQHPYTPNGGADGTPYWYQGLKAILEKKDYQNPKTGKWESVCDVVNDPENRIDQVWIWKDVGDRETKDKETWDQEYFWVYPDDSPMTDYKALCNTNRTFVAFSLNMSVLQGATLHAIGHSFEQQIDKMQGNDLFWTKWVGGSGSLGRGNICGNVHFPPNTAGQYDYTNTTTASSSCENWKPDGSGTKTNVSCNTWSCLNTAEEDYMTWWIQNMPHASQNLQYQGKTIPTWWDFIFDVENNVARLIAEKKYVDPSLYDYFRPSYIYGRSSSKQQNVDSSILFKTTDKHVIRPGLNRDKAGTFVFVTYRDPNYNAEIDNITLGNQAGGVSVQALTDFDLKQSAAEYRSEVFWLKNPPVSGVNAVTKELIPQNVVVTFTDAVQDVIVHTLTISGIDYSQNVTAFGKGDTSGNYSIPVTGTGTNTITLGMVGAFSKGFDTKLDPIGNTVNVTSLKSDNILSKISAMPGSGSKLEWRAEAGTNWTGNAVVMKLDTSTTVPTPLPTPVPTPDPTPNPTPVNTPTPSDSTQTLYEYFILDNGGNQVLKLEKGNVGTITIPTGRFRFSINAPAMASKVKITVREPNATKSKAQTFTSRPYVTKKLRRIKGRYNVVIRFYDQSGTEILDERAKIRFTVK